MGLNKVYMTEFCIRKCSMDFDRYTSKVDISLNERFYELCESGSFFPRIDNFNRYVSKIGIFPGTNFYEYNEFASFSRKLILAKFSFRDHLLTL